MLMDGMTKGQIDNYCVRHLGHSYSVPAKNQEEEKEEKEEEEEVEVGLLIQRDT